MSVFTDRIAPVSESSVRSQFTALCVAAGLKITNWRVQGVGNQIKEAVISGLFFFVQVVPVYVRGFVSLDLSTDPGDVDPYDSGNVSLAPGPGFLSEFGQNTFSTTREEASFATGFGTFTNSGPGARVLEPEALVFTWTGGSPPSPAPTYTNADDPVLYSGGTLTVPAGTSVTIPIVAQQIGSASSAPSSTLTLTTSLAGCSFTNANPVIGNDREDADTYRARCRLAAARLSLAGPADAIRYLAAKNLDGTPLLNDATSPVPTSVTRVQVTEDSSTGIVSAYYASPSGPAIPDDVSAANRNIQIQAYATADAITFNGSAAGFVTVHVRGTAKIKNRAGVTGQAVAEGIVAALTVYFETVEIGGLDQVAGSGVLYTVDLAGIGRDGYPGTYDLVLSLPGGATTAISVGAVPVLQSVAGDGAGSGDWTITLT